MEGNCLRGAGKSNPNLAGMEFAWTATDGEIFPCEEWMPLGSVRGLVVCVPGMGGAATDFLPFGEAVAREGFVCVALNLRGQGLDPVAKRRGAYLDMKVIASDVAAFALAAQKRFPGVPVFFCGESMGALIVTWLLAHDAAGVPVRGAIFSTPVVELNKPTPWSVRLMLRVLAVVVPHGRFHPSWFVSGRAAPLRTTRDEDHARRVRGAAHYIGVYTFRFLHELGGLMDFSRAVAARVKVPCLVLAGGGDVFLRPEQVRAWFDSLGSEDRTFRLYPQAYHLLWNDWDREIVLGDIADWLRERVSI